MADPFNLRAVTQVFQTKGRETQRSLPILVNDLIMAEDLAGELSNRFYLLAVSYTHLGPPNIRCGRSLLPCGAGGWRMDVSSPTASGFESRLAVE